MTAAVTILLVDEEPILRRATALMLTDRGAQVSAIASLSEAIALTEGRIFDVAVIDLPPRGPSPAEIVEQLHTCGTLPRRLVVCSCAPLGRDEAQPFAAILPKPYDFERLLLAVFGTPSGRRPSRASVSPRLRTDRAVAFDSQRASAASFKGTRRAARARRDRG